MKYWKNLALQVGLIQAILEYVAQVGDVDETELTTTFGISIQEARMALEAITID